MPSAGRSTRSPRWAAFASPAPPAGQIVNVALIVLGVGTLFYALATVVDFFVAGHLGDLLGRPAHAEDDRLPRTTTTSSAGSAAWGARSRATCRAARADYVVVDSNAQNRDLADTGRCASSRATEPTRRCFCRPASPAPARSSRVRTPTRTTCSSRSPPASCAQTSRSWRGRRWRTPRRSSSGPGPIA